MSSQTAIARPQFIPSKPQHWWAIRSKNAPRCPPVLAFCSAQLRPPFYAHIVFEWLHAFDFACNFNCFFRIRFAADNATQLHNAFECLDVYFRRLQIRFSEYGRLDLGRNQGVINIFPAPSHVGADAQPKSIVTKMAELTVQIV
jgi:hypothetical protein